VGTLFHLTVTFDGTNVQAYYDGVAASVAQGAATVDAPLDTNKDWMIGKVDHVGFGGIFFFKGLLDEVFIYDRALTGTEVTFLATPSETHFVDDDGIVGFGSPDCDGVGVGAYGTIQDAVDAANSGETVYVCPGTYDEQVVIASKDLTLQGAGDTTIIQPSAPAMLASLYTYPAGTFWPGTVMASIILVKDTGATTVKDLKVDGVNVTTVPAGASRVAGILYGESAGVVDNATVTTMVVDGYATRSYGIDLSAVGTARGVEVKDSDITNWSRNGIQAQGASLTADIHDNTLVGPDDVFVGAAVPNGILFIHGTGGNATSNTISALHHSLSGSRSAGILFYDPVVPGIVVEDNDISDVDDGVNVAHNANDVIVRLNNLHDNLEVGIHLEDGATGTTITGNTITGNLMAGIRFAGAADPGGPSLADDPPGAGNVANRNNISGNTDGVVNYDDTPQVFDSTCNWWGDVSGPSGSGPGTGDSVTTNVTFQPWLTTSDLVGGPCDGPLTTLTVVKTVVNDNGGTNVVADFVLSVGDGNATTTVVSGATTTLSADVEYTVSETSQAGYTAGVWGGDCAADGTITLTNGQAATCTITNDDEEPSLTLQKTVVNDNSGTADANDWTVTATGPTSFSGSGPIVANGPSFDAGVYNLSEVGPAGYTASAWVCVNGNQTDGDTVEIGLGQNVLCTITNNDDPPPIPTLTVVKIVVNDNGGTKVIANFPLFIDGFSVTSGVASTTSPGLHTVSETSQTGYLGTIGGDCAPDGTVTLASGEHKTCTITNDDLPPPATNSCDTPLVAPAGYILVNGSVGNDNVALSPFTMFVGNGGNDKVRALASGNYIICLGSGKDTVTLNGSGAVTIDAGDGDNTVTAMGTVVGYVKTGGGKDKLTFGSGERTILAGEGDNTVTALGSGNQTITTGTGNDKITTGSGNDVIVAGDGKNTVVAGAGSDSLTGGSGKDIFNGGPGTDTCNAGGGANTVVGCEL